MIRSGKANEVTLVIAKMISITQISDLSCDGGRQLSSVATVLTHDYIAIFSRMLRHCQWHILLLEQYTLINEIGELIIIGSFSYLIPLFEVNKF